MYNLQISEHFADEFMGMISGIFGMMMMTTSGKSIEELLKIPAVMDTINIRTRKLFVEIFENLSEEYNFSFEIVREFSENFHREFSEYLLS